MESKKHICVYCGQQAFYKLKNGKWCCSQNYQSCAQLRRKNREKQHQRYKNRNSGLLQWNKKRKEGKVVSWNKGLTKDTDERVAKGAKKLKEKYKNKEIENGFKGHHWNEEDKKRISEQRKKYLSEHPDKVPYLLNHSSNISYPERYFKIVFCIEKID